MVSIDKEFLINELVYKRRYKAQLAVELGISLFVLNSLLKKYDINIPRRSSRAYDNLKNKEFGRLKVKEESGFDKFGKRKWRCKCKCGNTVEVNASSLIRNLTKSCGCWKHEVAHKGYKEISVNYWRRLVLESDSRKIIFDITPEQVWEKYKNQDYKCALTGVDITFHRDNNKSHLQTASIDRIDSKLHYTIDNIQIVHKVINVAKMAMSNEQFMSWCNLVAQNHPINIDSAKEIALSTKIRKSSKPD